MSDREQYPMPERGRWVVRFWSHVDDTAGPGGCWPWRLTPDASGYGRFSLTDENGRRDYRPHRIAWTLAHDADPGALFVCHHCDNPPCCNPAHLFLGTNSDNMRDMVAKGRHMSVVRPESLRRGDAHPSRLYPEKRPRGSRHWKAKLTEADVRAIRDAHAAGATLAALGRRYGVSAFSVGNIVHRRGWRHVS